MSIYQKINAVMKKVAYVQKDKSVSGMGEGYKAVTHDQLVSVLRSALVEAGLMVKVTQTRGHMNEAGTRWDKNAGQLVPASMRLYEGEYDVSLIDCEDGAEITVHVEAHAMDSGDKAPGKAMTYATKTALLKLFWLETGESDESREEVRERSKPKLPKLSDERFNAAVEKVKSGQYPIADLKSKWDLSESQSAAVAALEQELAQ